MVILYFGQWREDLTPICNLMLQWPLSKRFRTAALSEIIWQKLWNDIKIVNELIFRFCALATKVYCLLVSIGWRGGNVGAGYSNSFGNYCIWLNTYPILVVCVRRHICGDVCMHSDRWMSCDWTRTPCFKWEIPYYEETLHVAMVTNRWLLHVQSLSL